VEAIGFVGKVATAAEAANHHPDIDIRYDKVLIRSWSHDAGGITQRDLDLAAAIDTIQTG
jgi:4a-hydroxytetrahydrobiopterin dehydratase